MEKGIRDTEEGWSRFTVPGPSSYGYAVASSIPPSNLRSEDSERSPDAIRKRPRPSGDDEGDFPAKVVARSRDIIFRVVVPSIQIGKVIGVKGGHINQIREETGASIKIADALAPFEERVIIISSNDDESEVSNAEHALQRIARIILQENKSGVETPKVGPAHSATNMIKLLVAGSQAGGLIGVSGHSIAEIRSSSGASVQIMPPNHLPTCASLSESDRLVQITGGIPEILKALEKITCKLREKPPQRVILTRPTYGFKQEPMSQPPPVNTVTFEMMVAESLVGGLIGKHGSNISNFRLWSGATIRVIGGRGERPQRQIRIEGTGEQLPHYFRSQVSLESCILHNKSLESQGLFTEARRGFSLFLTSLQSRRFPSSSLV